MKIPHEHLRRIGAAAQPRHRSAPRPLHRLTILIAAATALSVLAGCLGEPEIDERWTKLEFVTRTPAPGQALPADQAVDVTVHGRITYRDIKTGFLVAEARYSDTLSPAQMPLDPDEHTLEHALAVENILANSVTAGRATRAVTGFDHLMETIELDFTASVPAAMLAGGPDSMATRGLFLVLYMGEGDEIELPAGQDSLVVTPFPVEASEVLFSGFPLQITYPGGGPTP